MKHPHSDRSPTDSPTRSDADFRWDCLVIGYGNELRGDDAVGPWTAMAVDQWRIPGVGAIAIHQLVPELAPIITDARTVIFVDAIAGSQSDDIQIKAIQRSDLQRLQASSTTFSHHCDPATLLVTSRLLYGDAPEGWLLQIPAQQFEFGWGLSAKAKQGIQQALQAIQNYLCDAQEPCSVSLSFRGDHARSQPHAIHH